jgi:hypothetical protein
MLKLLGDIIESEEENKNYENLSMVFNIFKNILLISNQTIVETLVHDDFYLITFGALEYDNESVASKKFIEHRKFLNEQAKFKNIFNIDDATIIEKIKVNYRLTYMRDVAIARFIEETTIKNINLTIHYNNSEIIQYFISHKTILKSLFELISADKFESKYEGMSFLMELNQISKELIHTKTYFFETLCELNFLEIIENLFVFLSVGRKIRFVKHNHLYTEENHKYEEIPPDERKKREIMEISSIEIMICCLSVAPSKHICKCRSCQRLHTVKESKAKGILNAE